ncbi:MAG: Gfo/Idh/MocA family oxidoreductase [bacterium]
MNGSLGVSFIGLGWWGEVLAGAAKDSGIAHVVGGYARTPATRAAFATNFGCRNYESLKSLLSDPACEAVVIASSNSAHLEHALAAARAGKHIHLEKPMALSVSGAKEIVAACAAAGVKLSIGQNFRRWPMFRRAKELLQAGGLGRVSLASAHLSYHLGLTSEEGSPRWDPAENPGGPLYSYSIHLADLMEALFGEIETVDAACGKVGGPAPIEDAAAAVLRFQSGMVGLLAGSYTAPFLFSFGIEGSEASLRLSSERGPLLQKIDEGPEEAEELDPGMGYLEGRRLANSEQFTDLARCVREGGEPEVSGVHGVRALAVMRAMLRSQAERRTVRMEEILETD